MFACVANNLDSAFLVAATLTMDRVHLAFVRDASSQMEQALRMEEPSVPFSLERFNAQHSAYVKALSSVIPRVVTVSGSAHLPDCVFIEVSC